MNPKPRPLRGLVFILLCLLMASCGDKEQAGLAETRALSTTESTDDATSASASGTAESVPTSQDGTTTPIEPTTTTTATSTTTTSTTTSTTTTTSSTTTSVTLAVAAGLPTADDVARQYYTLCVETSSRELVDKWFEPGVLDELNCRRSDEEDVGRGFTELSPCEAIPGAAGDATHGCFVYYEGGGYTLLIGDLGRGYRGLAVTFVVD